MQVEIVDGWRYGKDYSLRLIFSAIAPLEILPIMYQQDGINAVFFVNDCGKAIKKLCSMNLKIFNPTGRKLVLQIELRYPMANDICVRGLIGKTVMSNMYDHTEKILHLSKFHKNPELDKWMYCPLTLKKVVDEVIAVTCNTLASLRVIILSHNGLTNLSGFSYLAQNAPNLRVLDLQNNSIPEMSSLDSLTGLQLHELILDGNPLCESFENDLTYINEVRNIFPAIIKLDGVPVPPPGLPVSKGNYVCDLEGEVFAEKFITYYFKYYDGWNGQSTRFNLLGSYHKEAFFSLSAESFAAPSPQYSGRLNKYLFESRNLLKMSDYLKSNKSLHLGRDDVVKALSRLPLTEHDRESMHVDLTHYSSTLVIMTVRGIFRELDVMEPCLRSFNRVFAFSRNNNNYSIVNDMLFISNVTKEQAESLIARFPPVTSKPSRDELLRQAQNDKNFEIKQNMVEELSRATEMNLKWSRKCLIETEWDFQEALIIFMGLYKEGSIPPEAFKL
ncbi:hypothetical protein J437_LFUL008524 [Ladona fulva]|uniref:Nuclear RNA export factor 2 n=1 Tax=Ladona fulva TaxID=123851 RepID=A0A8K0K7Q5_LADFU|nr:hypothetical protein J437_LFUL008524 [Ladona fulva]